MDANSPLRPVTPSAPTSSRVRPAAPRHNLGANAGAQGKNSGSGSGDGSNVGRLNSSGSSGSFRSGREEEPVEEIHPTAILLHDLIGSGVTAEVHRGTWKGQTVAVKKMTRLRRMDVKEQVTFNREVSVLRRVVHPNLVSLLGVCLSERPFTIVTEFCEGGTLFELVHNCVEVELTWPQNMKMCLDVAQAMAYLHGYDPPIVHRDLKSLNLLLATTIRSSSDKPCVKVSDFGLAKMTPIDEVHAKMTSMVGTVNWMAPEVFHTTNYSAKVDVYSYAIVLFEVICREPPFEDVDPASIEHLVKKGERPDLEAVPPDCPHHLRRLMISCWAQAPDSRPSFQHILSVLNGVQAGGLIPGSEAPATSRPTSASRRGEPHSRHDPEGYVSKSLARGPGNVTEL